MYLSLHFFVNENINNLQLVLSNMPWIRTNNLQYSCVIVKSLLGTHNFEKHIFTWFLLSVSALLRNLTICRLHTIWLTNPLWALYEYINTEGKRDTVKHLYYCSTETLLTSHNVFHTFNYHHACRRCCYYYYYYYYYYYIFSYYKHLAIIMTYLLFYVCNIYIIIYT